MKTKILPAALIAAAGLALAPSVGRSQTYSTTTVSVTGTDLFLGFEETGNSYNLIADIGPYTRYLNATSPFTIQFGVIPTGQTGAGSAVTSLNTDLTGLFGSWATSSGVSALKWGVVGQDPNLPLLFVTEDSTVAAPRNASYSNIGTPLSNAGSLESTLGTDYSTTASTVAANVPSTATVDNPNSWSSFNPYTNAFGTGLNIEQAPGDGPLSTLNLYEEIPNTNGTGTAKDLGTFTLGSNGSLTFSPVPEPSTWLSLIGGALFLGFFRSRRSVRPS